MAAGAYVYTKNEANQEKETTNSDTNTADDDDKTRSVEVTHLRGTITRIMPGCGPDLYLDENGNPARSDESSPCDAGAYVMVNDIKIQTASGYTTAEYSFTTDMSDLEPGQSVDVNYIKGSETTGTLNCDDCYIVRELDNPRE